MQRAAFAKVNKELIGWDFVYLANCTRAKGYSFQGGLSYYPKYEFQLLLTCHSWKCQCLDFNLSANLFVVQENIGDQSIK